MIMRCAYLSTSMQNAHTAKLDKEVTRLRKIAHMKWTLLLRKASENLRKRWQSMAIHIPLL